MKKFAFLVFSVLLAGCAATPRQVVQPVPKGPVEVQILAINDFHGNLEPPNLTIPAADGAVPAGGAAYLASALKQLRTSNSVTVAAGDLIGASPISSALFLDEPSIKALGMAGLELASVGNHEFDKGAAELKRMQDGGCAKFTNRQPCAVEPFAGAAFQYLSANVQRVDGTTLFPGTAVKEIGGLKIGFIGMTLKETKTLVSPSGVVGLNFADEAATANALVPGLKAAGANTIVLLIHQGASVTGRYDDPACPGLAGDIMPVIAKLDPAIQLIVSGHTHNAYICRVPIPDGGTRLLTSAGRYGTLLTDIRLTFDRPGGSLSGEKGEFVIVQGQAIQTARLTAPLVSTHSTFQADPAVAALVERYRDAAAGAANRPIGHLGGALLKGETGTESQAAGFISDGQLYVARNPSRGNADFGLMNNGGARTDLLPEADGTVRFGQIFAMQPFANNVVTKSYTGAQIKAVLEQQFASGTNSAGRPNLLTPSSNFNYSYDRSRPAGERIVAMKLNGKLIDPLKTYRVTINNFLASGGDNFTRLADGRDPVDAGLDLDATEAYLASNPKVPSLGRVTDLTPTDWTPPVY
jgi:5'-nucleotidase